MLTIYEVLRAIVRAESASLNSAHWVAEALAAIDRHEHAAQAAAAADDPAPTPEPAATPAPSPEVPQ